MVTKEELIGRLFAFDGDSVVILKDNKTGDWFNIKRLETCDSSIAIIFEGKCQGLLDSWTKLASKYN